MCVKHSIVLGQANIVALNNGWAYKTQGHTDFYYPVKRPRGDTCKISLPAPFKHLGQRLEKYKQETVLSFEPHTYSGSCRQCSLAELQKSWPSPPHHQCSVASNTCAQSMAIWFAASMTQLFEGEGAHQM